MFGTVGYQAPEIAAAGPSVASDLFTVGRTLAVLCIDFRGYQSTYRFTLPPPRTVPLFARYDSLYRFLLKGTAADPDERFQSAEEMADQLYGVLREIVADAAGTPVPAPSTQFTARSAATTSAPTGGPCHIPRSTADDPAAGYLATITTADPAADDRAAATRRPSGRVEVELRHRAR